MKMKVKIDRSLSLLYNKVDYEKNAEKAIPSLEVYKSEWEIACDGR